MLIIGLILYVVLLINLLKQQEERTVKILNIIGQVSQKHLLD